MRQTCRKITLNIYFEETISSFKYFIIRSVVAESKCLPYIAIKNSYEYNIHKIQNQIARRHLPFNVHIITGHAFHNVQTLNDMSARQTVRNTYQKIPR